MMRWSDRHKEPPPPFFHEVELTTAACALWVAALGLVVLILVMA